MPVAPPNCPNFYTITHLTIYIAAKLVALKTYESLHYSYSQKNSLILSLQSSLNSLTLEFTSPCNCAFSPIPLLKCSQTDSTGVSQITQECTLISLFSSFVFLSAWNSSLLPLCPSWRKLKWFGLRKFSRILYPRIFFNGLLWTHT